MLHMCNSTALHLSPPQTEVTSTDPASLSANVERVTGKDGELFIHTYVFICYKCACLGIHTIIIKHWIRNFCSYSRFMCF